MCSDAGFKLLYLPPYSPDLNPIKEFFAKLKHFIKQNWQDYERVVTLFRLNATWASYDCDPGWLDEVKWR
jgi:transposase